MFRVPIWRMSAYSATMSTWAGSMTSVITGRPRPLARLGEVAEALDAQALEAVRAGPRLERAAADDRRAVRRDVVDGLEQLLAALDRARARPSPSASRRRSTASRTRMTLSSGWNSRETSLYGSVIGVTCSTPGGASSDAHQLRPPRADLAHDRDHGPARAGVLERRESLGEDPALHAVDLGLAGAIRHHHEHLASASPRSPPHPSENKRAEVRDLCSPPGTTRASRVYPGTVMPGRKARDGRPSVPRSVADAGAVVKRTAARGTLRHTLRRRSRHALPPKACVVECRPPRGEVA